MEILNRKIKEGFFMFIYHNNAPMPDIADVITSTEKAVQIRLQGQNYSCWLPKSAFEYMNGYDCFTLKKWFKSKLSDEKNKNTCRALGVLK